MDGYRQTSFDPDAGEPITPQPKVRWWQVLLGMLAYMIPLFWLQDRVAFPDSLGVHIAEHGKAALVENWYYSYLLLRRHSPLDVFLFLYMWAPVVGLIAWFAYAQLSKDDPTQEYAPASLSTPSIFDAEEAAQRRRRVLIALAISLAFGALLIAIFYFKGA